MTFKLPHTTKARGKTMAKTYRDVAIEQMVATTKEAMSGVIDWWGELPTPMNEALTNFASNLGQQSIRSNL